MSLVINGMEMPKNCNECPMYFYEGQGICSCRVLSAIEDDEVLKPWKKKRKDCPLIEIPDKHGRLIDADALRQEMYHQAFETDTPMQKWDSGCWIRYKMFENAEETAPTIIPPKEE